MRSTTRSGTLFSRSKRPIVSISSASACAVTYLEVSWCTHTWWRKGSWVWSKAQHCCLKSYLVARACTQERRQSVDFFTLHGHVLNLHSKSMEHAKRKQLSLVHAHARTDTRQHQTHTSLSRMVRLLQKHLHREHRVAPIEQIQGQKFQTPIETWSLTSHM